MSTIDTLSVNAIRVLSADAIQKANSGHPGLPLGCAPTAYELWMNHMNHNPATRSGQTATALFFLEDTARCCCILCFTCLDTEIFPRKI